MQNVISLAFTFIFLFWQLHLLLFRKIFSHASRRNINFNHCTIPCTFIIRKNVFGVKFDIVIRKSHCKTVYFYSSCAKKWINIQQGQQQQQKGRANKNNVTYSMFRSIQISTQKPLNKKLPTTLLLYFLCSFHISCHALHPLFSALAFDLCSSSVPLTRESNLHIENRR